MRPEWKERHGLVRGAALVPQADDARESLLSKRAPINFLTRMNSEPTAKKGFFGHGRQSTAFKTVCATTFCILAAH